MTGDETVMKNPCKFPLVKVPISATSEKYWGSWCRNRDLTPSDSGNDPDLASQNCAWHRTSYLRIRNICKRRRGLIFMCDIRCDVQIQTLYTGCHCFPRPLKTEEHDVPLSINKRYYILFWIVCMQRVAYMLLHFFISGVWRQGRFC